MVAKPCVLSTSSSTVMSMTVTPTTTIRVPRPLHSVLAEQARQRDTTIVSVIEQGLTELLDAEFWRQVNEGMSAPAAAATIQADMADWDATVKDGLDEEDWSWLT